MPAMQLRTWVGLVCGTTLLATRPTTTRADSMDVLRTAYEHTRSQAEQLSRKFGSLHEDVSATVTAIDDTVQLIELFVESNMPTSAVVTATATLDAGGEKYSGGGAITAHVQARLVGEFCDLAAVGMLARGSGGIGRSGGSGTGEVRVWGSACLPRGLTLTADDLNAPDPDVDPNAPQLLFPSTTTVSIMPLRLSAHVALNASPSFTSMRNEPLRTFSETAYSIGTEGARFSLYKPDRGFSLVYGTIAQRWEWAGLPASGEAGYELPAQFGFFRLFRVRSREAVADRSIDFLDFKLHGVRFVRSAAILDLAPVRINGLSLGSDHLLGDASFGLGASGGTITSSDGGTVMNSDDVPKITTWVGKFGVTEGSQAQALGVQFVRTLDSNVAAQLALENRVTAWGTLNQTELRSRAEIFGGSAKHYFDKTTSGQERFVGVAVNVDYAVATNWWLGLRGEGVTSYARDATLDGRISDDGFRGFATLTWTSDLYTASLTEPDEPTQPAEAPTEPPAVDPASSQAPVQ